MLTGIFIGVFVVVMVFVNSLIDHLKDKQFGRLMETLIDEEVTVTRGKFGSTEQHNIWNLVVGDVISVKSGQKIPADCLVLSGAEFKVDEDVESKFRAD